MSEITWAEIERQIEATNTQRQQLKANFRRLCEDAHDILKLSLSNEIVVDRACVARLASFLDSSAFSPEDHQREECRIMCAKLIARRGCLFEFAMLLLNMITLAMVVWFRCIIALVETIAKSISRTKPEVSEASALKQEDKMEVLETSAPKSLGRAFKFFLAALLWIGTVHMCAEWKCPAQDDTRAHIGGIRAKFGGIGRKSSPHLVNMRFDPSPKDIAAEMQATQHCRCQCWEVDAIDRISEDNAIAPNVVNSRSLQVIIGQTHIGRGENALKLAPLQRALTRSSTVLWWFEQLVVIILLYCAGASLLGLHSMVAQASDMSEMVLGDEGVVQALRTTKKRILTRGQ